MNVSSTMDGQGFVWDSEKGLQISESMAFDPMMPAKSFLINPPVMRMRALEGEVRQACIGLTTEYRLLYVVHVIREGDVLRLISARLAEPAERRPYEDD